MTELASRGTVWVMSARIRFIALFVTALVIGTGSARTAHMLVDHAQGGSCHHVAVASHGSGCDSHADHDHHDHGHQDSPDEPADDGSHEGEPCDLCAVISAIASSDAGSTPAVVPTIERETVLVVSVPARLGSVDRTPRSSRGPPAVG